MTELMYLVLITGIVALVAILGLSGVNISIKKTYYIIGNRAWSASEVSHPGDEISSVSQESVSELSQKCITKDT